MAKYQALIEVMNVRPKVFIVGLSLMVALIAAWESRELLLPSTQPISEPRILIAVRELEEGKRIALTDLSFKPLTSLGVSPEQYAFTDQDLPLVQGKSLNKKVSRGSPLLFDTLYSTLGGRNSWGVPAGMKLFFLSCELPAASSMGSEFNLIFKPFSPQKSPFALVENVLIVGIKTQPNESGVVVALKPTEVEWIENNLRFGRVAIVSQPLRQNIRNGALKKAKHRAQKTVKVEMITEEP